MHVWQRLLVAAVVAFTLCLTASSPASPPDARAGGIADSPSSATPLDARLQALEEQAFKQAAALVGPSVVRIQTVGGLDVVGRLLTGTGATTGVIVSDDGYIISGAFNFVSKPDSILVELPDGRRFPAKRVATDHLKQLTLLKIDATGLQPAKAAPKHTTRVGQWAIAVGHTYDPAVPSVSVGIISAVNRIWGKAVQTDAKVSPVNYGGPLVDVEGRVLGVLVPLSPNGGEETAGVEWYDSGIGFAIPMQDVYAVLDRLKQGDDLRPGLMGISLRGGSLLAEDPVIDRVRVQSPADQAGLKTGDLLVEIDGRPVTRYADVKYALGTKYAGETVSVAVRRNEDTIRADVTLVAELLPYESGFLGILPVRPPVDAARVDELKDTESQRDTKPNRKANGGVRPAVAPGKPGGLTSRLPGVGIRFVYPDSPAFHGGLKPRDRIVRFNGEDVTDAVTLTDLVGRLRPGDTTSLTYRREGVEQTIDVELAAMPNSVPPELPTAVIPSARSNKPDIRRDTGTRRRGDLRVSASPRLSQSLVGPAGIQTGRFTAKLPNSQQSYWVYVPDDYNPAYSYGLMVWLHPNGDTMEAAIYRQWRSMCDRRGLIIVAPQADNVSGWTPNEAEFVKQTVNRMQETYTIDPARVFLHGFSEGGRFAYHLAFKYRELFRGVAVAAAPLAERPPENDPDFRLQFHLVCGEDDDLFPRLEATVEALKRLKYPVSFTSLKGHGHKYPAEEAVREIARWADALDRI